MGEKKSPVTGNWKVSKLQRRELDQKSTAGPAGKNSGVVHSAATGADELLAVREHPEQFPHTRVRTIRLEQSQGESDEQCRRRRKSCGLRQIRSDKSFNAGARSPFGARECR